MDKLRLMRDLTVNWQLLVLDKTEAHHLINVQRAKVGDKIVLSDCNFHNYLAEIEYINASGVGIKFIGEINKKTEPPFNIHLWQGFPKGEKWETILQKGVELGVTDFHPTIMKRSIVRLNPANLAKKKSRWENIVASASLQCGRSSLPRIHVDKDWQENLRYFANLPNAILLVLWEDEVTVSLRHVLQEFSGKNVKIENVVVTVGPEGGIDFSEIKELKEAGFISVSLGTRILRTETAGLAALANLNYQFEQK